MPDDPRRDRKHSGPNGSARDDFLEMPAAAFAAPFLDSMTLTGATAAESETLAALQAALGDRYRMERELGRGGMATVYLAHDLKHARAVAIKVLHADATATLGADRFVREIETVAGLSHPHILPLFDSGAVPAGHPERSAGPTLLYYVMPYVEGESLRDRLHRERQLPVPVALGIVREVADALAYAHRRGIVHRDIKPGNILLTSTGGTAADSGSHALLADFGIARALAAAETGAGASGRPADPLTATGTALGTPTYMSPEQASGEREIDGRSDVYSLGCVLYEMLAGEPPFTGPTAQAILTKRMTGPPPSVRRVRPNVSAHLDATIARAMAPVAADRYQSADELLDALARAATGSEPRTKRALNRRVVAAVGGAVALMAVISGFFLWRTRPVVSSSASAMVILPPTPVTPDSQLTRLGRELAITLGANLDGVGGIRVADALSVLANLSASAPALSLEEARTFAQRLGARSVVRGTLIRVGDSVRVDVALHRTVCPPNGCGQPLASVAVSAPGHDIAALTEQTTWALLREVWQREGAPTPSLAAVTTRSIPALRAFLEGERAIVDGLWRAAPAAYERAFTQDTTFLLAYWRYAFARNYWSLPVDASIRAKYREHRSRFPQRDSLLIEAEIADSLSATHRLTKLAAERFPDYWPATWMLADRLAHAGPLIGTTSRELRAALEQTVSLNPRMTSAWSHLFWVAMWERDTVLADRVLRQLTVLRFDTVSVREQGFDELAYFAYAAEVVRGGGVPRDTSIRLPGVGILAAAPGSINPLMLGLGSSWYGLAREQVEMSTRVIARNPAPAVVAGHYLAIAVAQAQRGAWDSSLVALEGFVARVPDATAAVYPYRIAVVGAWLGGLAPEVASARRAAAVRDSASLPPASRAELAWLDGLLATATRDSIGVARARAALRGGDSASAPMLDRSLAAFADALAGQRDRAADSLVALERERAERGWSRYRGDAYPFLTAVNRLAAARWLRERGQAGDAERLLSWHEAVVVPLRTTRQANAVVQGLAYLERARVAESLGRGDVARDYYQRFLWHYDAPTALHRHLVEEARQALERLGPGDRAPGSAR